MAGRGLAAILFAFTLPHSETACGQAVWKWAGRVSGQFAAVCLVASRQSVLLACLLASFARPAGWTPSPCSGVVRIVASHQPLIVLLALLASLTRPAGWTPSLCSGAIRVVASRQSILLACLTGKLRSLDCQCCRTWRRWPGCCPLRLPGRFVRRRRCKPGSGHWPLR